MRRAYLVLGTAMLAGLASPIHAQSMPGMDHGHMPGMTMPDMDMGDAAPPAGAAPTPPSDHYADRQFDPADMERARMAMMDEEGGQPLYMVLLNLAELQAYQGQLGYRWDGEAWFGGDIDRVTVKSEGDGSFRKGVGSGEVQALYSRAIDPYFNLQAGIRQDLQSFAQHTYASFGFEGLAPYWVETSGTLFVSTEGKVLGRLEGYYDQNITQRLILQPRIELNFAAQDSFQDRIGAGLSTAELGLRLRYEIMREFAPYIGVSYDTSVGQTAQYVRKDGVDPSSVRFVFGARIWF